MAKKNTSIVKGLFNNNVQKVDYSSGFLVGKTPLNKVVITFYNDIPALPNGFEIEIDDESRFVGERKTEENEYAIQRIVQNVIQIDEDVAAELAHLILAMLEEKNDADAK